jgi:hypothetical protein
VDPSQKESWEDWYELSETQRKLLLFIGTTIVLVANPDFIIIPALRASEITGLYLLIIGNLIATLELLWWFFFWRIVIQMLKKGKLKGRFARTYKEATDEHKNRTKFIKSGGITALFLLAASPEPFGRLVGVIFCALARSWKAFIAVAIGNIIHTSSVVYGWSKLFELFSF